MWLPITFDMLLLQIRSLFEDFCNPSNPSCGKVLIPIIVSIISLLVSASLSLTAIIYSYKNTTRTLEDKRRQTIIDNMSNFSSLFIFPITNDEQWRRISQGDYLNDKHQVYESNIVNTLPDTTAGNELKQEILKLRTGRPSTQAKVNIQMGIIKNKFKEWSEE